MDPAPGSTDVETEDGWRRYIEQHFDTQFHEYACSYVSVLLGRGFPVIFDLRHLAGRIGVSPALLRAVVAEPKYFYREFTIPKRRGGTRQIHAPYAAVATVQAWISESILSRIDVSDRAHGFVRLRSPVTNALEHLGARCILRIDIKDFFPTVNLPRVIAIFQSIGYNHEASYALARACTLDNKLPQGASTSPQLANLVARRLDARLEALAKSLDLVYTRYADDLA